MQKEANMQYGGRVCVGETDGQTDREGETDE